MIFERKQRVEEESGVVLTPSDERTDYSTPYAAEITTRTARPVPGGKNFRIGREDTP